MMDKYCFYCMEKMDSGEETCSFCGTKHGEVPAYPHQLQPGTVLNERYLIGRVLGQGGFGITYIGRDLRLDLKVAVKEYFPSGYANRNNTFSPEITITDKSQEKFIESGKQKFLNEARVMAKFDKETGIVNVKDFFECNKTAYIVMEYLEGQDLRTYLLQHTFQPDDIFERMKPVLKSLRKIHEKNIVHRDISPDNIMILEDGTLKLMDFGAARMVDINDQKSVSIILKAGYAPEEQYRSKGKQGPWTDIYALCATIYKCITGKTPEDSLERSSVLFSQREDIIEWPSELGIEISERYERVLKKGMQVQQRNRFQSIKEMEDAIAGTADIEDISSISIHNGEKSGSGGMTSEDGKTEYMPSEGEETVYLSEKEEEREEETVYLSEEEEEREEETVYLFEEEKEREEETVYLFEEEKQKEAEAKKAEEARQAEAARKADNPVEQETEEKDKKKILIPVAVGAAVVLGIGCFALFSGGGKNTETSVTNQTAVTSEQKSPEKEDSGDGKTDVTSSEKEDGTSESETTAATPTPEPTEAPTPRSFKMPKLVNLKRAKAEKTLKALGDAGLTLVVKEKFSTKKKGLVISQSIKNGTVWSEGKKQKIVLTVSKGEEKMTVPYVEGKTLSSALSLLQKKGLKGTVARKLYSSVIAEGSVIGQSVAAGKKVKKNTVVSLTVSLGKEPERNTNNNSNSNSNQRSNSNNTRKATPKPGSKEYEGVPVG